MLALQGIFELGETRRPMSAHESANPVNLQRLDEVTGGDPAFAIELLDLFLGDSGATILKLQPLIEQCQTNLLKREAHKLKGSAGNLGALRLAQLARAVEQAALKEDAATLHAHVAGIHLEFARVRAQLEQYRRMLTEGAGG
jgi:HPt (histidine-containing phosphotransfer) domain-containing protein